MVREGKSHWQSMGRGRGSDRSGRQSPGASPPEKIEPYPSDPAYLLTEHSAGFRLQHVETLVTLFTCQVESRDSVALPRHNLVKSKSSIC